MTVAGWCILAVSVGGVTGVFLWSIWKVLTAPDEAEHIHGFDSGLAEKEH